MTDGPLVLGIESSCDETGVGIVRGRTLLANVVSSSMDEHVRFGGVIPEIASRAHLDAIVPALLLVSAALVLLESAQRERGRAPRRLPWPRRAGSWATGWWSVTLARPSPRPIAFPPPTRSCGSGPTSTWSRSS